MEPLLHLLNVVVGEQSFPALYFTFPPPRWICGGHVYTTITNTLFLLFYKAVGPLVKRLLPTVRNRGGNTRNNMLFNS